MPKQQYCCGQVCHLWQSSHDQQQEQLCCVMFNLQQAWTSTLTVHQNFGDTNQREIRQVCRTIHHLSCWTVKAATCVIFSISHASFIQHLHSMLQIQHWADAVHSSPPSSESWKAAKYTPYWPKKMSSKNMWPKNMPYPLKMIPEDMPCPLPCPIDAFLDSLSDV